MDQSIFLHTKHNAAFHEKLLLLSQRGKKGGNRPFSQMYYESAYKIFSSVYIRYLIGAIPLPVKTHPYPARCVFSCRESALSSFIAASPGASLASTPKAFFFSFPFGWQCSKLRLACAQLSSLLFLISKVPSISRRRLLLWRYSAAVRPSAIPIDVKIRENHVQLIRSKL